jgi:hypothetical protein
MRRVWGRSTLNFGIEREEGVAVDKRERKHKDSRLPTQELTQQGANTDED